MKRSLAPVMVASLVGLMALVLGLSDPVPAPWLAVAATNLVQECVVDWQATPPCPNGEEGGTSSIVIVAYSGPGYVLSALNLVEGAMFVESSTDLTNWTPFPRADFQLTLTPTNATAIERADGPMMFFRGRMQQ